MLEERILVAGASGMAGSHIAKVLLKMGYRNVVGTWNSHRPPAVLSALSSSFQTVQIDLCSQDAVKDFFASADFDCVFLAAAKVGGILANDRYRAEFIYRNLMIQTNVIHQAYLAGVTRLLFLGSSCVYPKLAPQPIKEEYLLTGPLEPTNSAYALAKIAGIEMCDAYNRQYGTSYVAVMPTNLYGPQDNFDLETSHVLPALIRKFHLGKCLGEHNWEALRHDLNRRPIGGVDGSATDEEILCALARHGIEMDDSAGADRCRVILWGTGTPRREFLHVEDMAEACVFIGLETDHAGLLNIGTGNDLSITDLAETVTQIVGYQGRVDFDPSKPDGTPRKLLDVSKLNQLGWRPCFSLEDGIRETYRWYLDDLDQAASKRSSSDPSQASAGAISQAKTTGVPRTAKR